MVGGLCYTHRRVIGVQIAIMLRPTSAAPTAPTVGQQPVPLGGLAVVGGAGHVVVAVVLVTLVGLAAAVAVLLAAPQRWHAPVFVSSLSFSVQVSCLFLPLATDQCLLLRCCCCLATKSLPPPIHRLLGCCARCRRGDRYLWRQQAATRENSPTLYRVKSSQLRHTTARESSRAMIAQARCADHAADVTVQVAGTFAPVLAIELGLKNKIREGTEVKWLRTHITSLASSLRNIASVNSTWTGVRSFSNPPTRDACARRSVALSWELLQGWPPADPNDLASRLRWLRGKSSELVRAAYLWLSQATRLVCLRRMPSESYGYLYQKQGER